MMIIVWVVLSKKKKDTFDMAGIFNILDFTADTPGQMLASSSNHLGSFGAVLA